MLKNEIEKYHQKLNSEEIIDGTYYRRNKAVYELVSYINHIVACYYSKNYHSMATFLCRAKKFISKYDGYPIETSYRNILKDYLELIESFIMSLNDDYLDEIIKKSNGI